MLLPLSYGGRQLLFRNVYDCLHSSLKHIYPSEFTLSRVKCHKILIDLSSNQFAGITTLNYTIITLSLVSHLRSSVVRALFRHRKVVSSIPARGPIVDELFSTFPGWVFNMCMIQLDLKTHSEHTKVPHLPFSYSETAMTVKGSSNSTSIHQV